VQLTQTKKPSAKLGKLQADLMGFVLLLCAAATATAPLRRQVAYLYLKDGQRLQELMGWLLDEQRVVVWRSDMPKLAQQSSTQATTPQQQGGRRRRGASQ
jgi:hypothetical protein